MAHLQRRVHDDDAAPATACVLDLRAVQRHYLDAPGVDDVVMRGMGASNDAAAPAELRAVLVTHYESLNRRLVRHLGCADLASECLHDAWLRLGDITVSPAIQSPDAYVYRVACNLAMDRLRHDRPLQRAGELEDELASVADATPGPEQVALARSQLAAVEKAFQGLPRRHRAVLTALRIDEQSREQVAAHHAISLRTVDTTLRQALQHCAEPAGLAILVGVSGARRRLPSEAVQRGRAARQAEACS